MMTFYDILSKLYPSLYSAAAIIILAHLFRSWWRCCPLVAPLRDVLAASLLILIPNLVLCGERSMTNDVSSIVLNVYLALIFTVVILWFLFIWSRHRRSLLCAGLSLSELQASIETAASGTSLSSDCLSVRRAGGAFVVSIVPAGTARARDVQRMLRSLKAELRTRHRRVPRAAALACLLHALCILVSAILTWGYAVGSF